MKLQKKRRLEKVRKKPKLLESKSIIDENKSPNLVLGGSDFLDYSIDLGINDIQGLTTSQISTITFDNSYADTFTLPSTSTYNISSGGTGGIYSTTIAGGTGYTWNDSRTVTIDADGLSMKEGADITIGKKSLTAAIEKIEERLGILQPNPELEQRWDTLKTLRQQYLDLEKDILEKEKIMKILKET